MGFSTDCIHAGNEPDPTTGAVAVPIYQTSTYVQQGIGKHKGYEYARTQNPTRARARREHGGARGRRRRARLRLGMAAITAISTFVKQGDHVVCSNMTYGGTYRYYTKILARYGVDVRLRGHVATRTTVERAIRPETKMLHLESPTNPTMQLCDIALLSELAPPGRRHRRRGQHLRLALPPEAARARRRHRHALDDEVPGRPLRHGRRHRRREEQGARRVARVRPEQLGRDPLADGLLARPARHQDARGPDGAPRGQRPRGRRGTWPSSRRSARSTIPAFPTIPSTRSRRSRCRGSAR